MKSKISTEALFAKAALGIGATEHCGSDSYGLWISYVDPKTKTIGVYAPRSWFKHDWTDGHMEVEAYKPGQKPERFFQAYRGKWREIFPGKTGPGWRVPARITVGHCVEYRDPSF